MELERGEEAEGEGCLEVGTADEELEGCVRYCERWV